MTAPVLVVGEALVDVIVRPEGRTVRPGGSPANVALGLARLGHATELLTAVGEDDNGRAVREWLAAAGAGIHPCTAALERTSVARATLDGQGVAAYDFDITWSIAIPDPADVGGRALVHVGSLALYLAPGADQVDEVVRLAHDAGVPLSVDANARPAILGPHVPAREGFERVAALATVVKLSDEDCAYLYPGESIDVVLDRLLHLGTGEDPGRVVVVTRGAEGVRFQTAHGHGVVDAPRVDVVDTIGAGDSFMSAFLSVLLEEEVRSWSDPDTVREASAFAVRCAAMTVGREGADPPRISEVGAA